MSFWFIFIEKSHFSRLFKFDTNSKTHNFPIPGDNQYFCDQCKILCDGLRSIHIIQPPKNLILTLKHFRYEKRYHTRQKLLHNVSHDETITLQIRSNVESNKIFTVKYTLYAAIVHCGEFFLLTKLRMKREKWEKSEKSEKSKNEVKKARMKWEKWEWSEKSENEVKKVRMKREKWEWSEKSENEVRRYENLNF